MEFSAVYEKNVNLNYFTTFYTVIMNMEIYTLTAEISELYIIVFF